MNTSEVPSFPSVSGRTSLNSGWLFGGPMTEGAEQPGFDDSGFTPITLPHANHVFSWRDVDPAKYEYVSIYRRRIKPEEAWRGKRVFVDFDAAMAAATVFVNGKRVGEHLGGYTPFSFELTAGLNPDGENVLAVVVDSHRRGDVPPFGGSVDYDTFGGLHRTAWLRAVPQAFIENVFAKPLDALTEARRLETKVFIEGPSEAGRTVEVTLLDGAKTLATARATAAPGETEVSVTLSGLGGVELWDVDHPRLYAVRARLLDGDAVLHEYITRVGFREARFREDGFFLNGRRLPLFGLNRHELHPYVGGAMPNRVHRQDAEILRHTLNCNVVRTSHYVQSPAFLDACDEVGLLVWDEIPGWQHVGDEAWRARSTDDAERMIRRDWNHPAVILWAVRINESQNDWPEWYDSLNALAHRLDDSRETTGAYVAYGQQTTREDVRGQNDYSDPLHPPDFPRYLVSEAVGQFNFETRQFDRKYRRMEPNAYQQAQALRHARAHDQVAADARYEGLIAWCAYDYNSPINPYRRVKCPGVCDIFRIPKPGAAFYQSQQAPEKGIIIAPAFFWDALLEEAGTVAYEGMICSNVDRLVITVGGEKVAELAPDREHFGHLPYPPFFVTLNVDTASRPDLRIDGYLDGKKVASRTFAGTPDGSHLVVEADADTLAADRDQEAVAVGADHALVGDIVSLRQQGVPEESRLDDDALLR
jgi:beta-galactosidase